jgi:nucleoside-diphosphate-sugar epimerase
MKIFVTCGAGFIGSNFIRHVLSLNKGYQIVNYDKLTYARNLANLEPVADHADYSFVAASSTRPPSRKPCAAAMRSCTSSRNRTRTAALPSNAWCIDVRVRRTKTEILLNHGCA